jgi:hypothetical protein
MALARLTRLATPPASPPQCSSWLRSSCSVFVVGSGTISQAPDSATFYAPTLAALGSIIALLVALVAVFVRQSGDLGALGVAGFLVALVGTVLGAGGYWTYVFILPYLAETLPDSPTSPPARCWSDSSSRFCSWVWVGCSSRWPRSHPRLPAMGRRAAHGRVGRHDRAAAITDPRALSRRRLPRLLHAPRRRDPRVAALRQPAEQPPRRMAAPGAPNALPRREARGRRRGLLHGMIPGLSRVLGFFVRPSLRQPAHARS